MMHSTASTQHSPRILGVYAHPDDETFCVGGTLAKYAAAGAEVMVVSATQGEAGQIRNITAATRQTLGCVRAQELRRAGQCLGVAHTLCFDYGDGKLASIPQGVLVKQITEIIRCFRPHVVLTFGEDGAYGHPDHIAIGAATDDAFAKANDPTHCPEQVAAGLRPYRPRFLYHSYFPRRRNLLLEHLVKWLKTQDERFCGTLDFAKGLKILADGATTLGFSRDHIKVEWYPPGEAILEQGEAPNSVFFILSGTVDILRQHPESGLRLVGSLESGAFFGEDGIAAQQPRNAHVVARNCVSCLVFSPSQPTPSAGRGTEAQVATDDMPPFVPHIPATTCIDVADFVQHKVRAMAAYRTQCPIVPNMLPNELWAAMFAREYFIRIYPYPDMTTQLFDLVALPTQVFN